MFAVHTQGLKTVSPMNLSPSDLQLEVSKSKSGNYLDFTIKDEFMNEMHCFNDLILLF